MNSQYASQNPYDHASNPQMYQGSGWQGDTYANQYPGGPGASYSGGPYATGMLDTQTAHQDNPDQSYQRWTEDTTKTAPEAIETIDPDTGVAPRRLTDCVCLPIMVLYILGMIAIAAFASREADVLRLTRGYDYFGRLCGVDETVEDKPYLFWCRADPSETSMVPSALNLNDATCVSHCPMSGGAPVQCLMAAQARGEPKSSNAFGTVESYFVHVQQSIVDTKPYDTRLFSGRYCMPDDVTLKASVLHGPANMFIRAVKGFGSLKNSWGVMFLVVVVSVLLAYAYIFTFKYIGKYVLYGFLWATILILVVIALYFVVAAIYFIPNATDTLNFEIFSMQSYIDNNPFFQRNVPLEAAIYSILAGVFCLCGVVAFSGMLAHVESTWEKVADLIKVAYQCVFSMKEILIPPLFEVLFKFFTTWLLVHNLTYMLSVGYVDSRRIVVNDLKIQGASKKYFYNWWWLPWIVIYAFGGILLLEVFTAAGQFVVAHAVISWYYVEKKKDDNGDTSKDPPTRPALTAITKMLTFHFGSIFLGASIIPWFRMLRMTDFVLLGNLFGPDDECSAPCSVCSCCCKACTCCCRAISNIFKPCGKLLEFDMTRRMIKHAYNDVIIRSNHFLPGTKRVVAVQNSDGAAKSYTGETRIITFVGVTSIGIVCAGIAYNIFTSFSAFTDPHNSSYIQEPMACAVLAFCLCANCAYSVVHLIETACDVLLYVYAFSKKHKKGAVEKFIPDDLRLVVGNADTHTDAYPFYGKAAGNMYLSSWFSTGGGHGKPAPKKAPAPEKQASQMASQPPQQTGYNTNYGPYASYSQATGGPYADYPPETEPMLQSQR
mmetsp:Transcript_87860/g.246731  ORF Transcript_87860/g.246731 Transcript_87860/m.246731 type:complete len:830 (-) Transcript_87860:243-2732(-)